MLIDTSVWIDHFRKTNAVLAGLLSNNMALSHPHVIGELALGSLSNRRMVLADLSRLARPPIATDTEVLALIDSAALHGRGIGYIDAHLLASTRLGGVTLWTLDRRLRDVAKDLGIAATP